MNLKCLLLMGAILVLCSGCFWHFGPNRVSPSASASIPTASIEVFRPESLTKGGKLVFIPFTAGVNAEAGQALDRLSLMIIKGALAVFQEAPSFFQMNDQDDPDEADMLLEGRIDEFRSVGDRKFSGIGRKPGVIAVRGELWDRRTRERVARISVRREVSDRKKVDIVAYDIGREIAWRLIRQESGL